MNIEEVLFIPLDLYFNFFIRQVGLVGCSHAHVLVMATHLLLAMWQLELLRRSFSLPVVDTSYCTLI